MEFGIKVRYSREGAQLDAPNKEGDAGYDVYAVEDTVIPSRANLPVKVPTGIHLEFPKDYVCVVENKSGVATRNGLLFVNGIIDSGYRGEVQLMVYNMTDSDFTIPRGMKMAQLIFYRIGTPPLSVVSELDDSDRGSDGFGSTQTVNS